MLGPRRVAGVVIASILLVAPASAHATITAETPSPDVWLYGSGTIGAGLDLALTGDPDAISIVSRNAEPFGPPPPPSPGSSGHLCSGPDPSRVTCTSNPADFYPRLFGVSTILSGFDDRFDASGLRGVSITVSAGEGDDRMVGGDADDGLTGWTGVDEFHGGAGNDYLYMSDHPFDSPDPDSADSDCGPGDRDVVKRDLEDPPLGELDGCEFEIPAYYFPPTLAGTAVVGAPLTVAEPGATGTGNPARYRWRSCAGAACGDVVGTEATYVPTTADVGHTMTVDVSRSVTGGPENRTYSAAAAARSAPVAASSATAPPSSVTAPPADATAPKLALRAVRASVDRRGRATLKLGRASEAGTGTLRIRGAGARSLRLVAGRTVSARVKLTPKALRALRRRGKLRVRATLTTRDAAGNAGRQRFRVTLAHGGA